MSNTISAVTGLLDLPLEIRRLIYKAIFAEGHAKITVEESTPPGRYETTLKQITQEAAILLTCRQTHNEARELFFGNAVLEVTDKVLELVPEKTLKRALSTMKAILVRERTGRVMQVYQPTAAGSIRICLPPLWLWSTLDDTAQTIKNCGTIQKQNKHRLLNLLQQARHRCLSSERMISFAFRQANSTELFFAVHTHIKDIPSIARVAYPVYLVSCHLCQFMRSLLTRVDHSRDQKTYTHGGVPNHLQNSFWPGPSSKRWPSQSLGYH